MSEDLLYLMTILEAIEKIKIYTQCFSSPEEFFKANTQKEFNATLTLLIAIGEESKKISNELKEETQSNWSAVARLRDKVSHDYRGINPRIVWNIVNDHIPTLKHDCISMVKKLRLNKEEIKEFLDSPYYSHSKYLLEEI